MGISTKQQMQMIATSHGSLAVEESGHGGIPVLLIHGNSFCRGVFHGGADRFVNPDYVGTLAYAKIVGRPLSSLERSEPRPFLGGFNPVLERFLQDVEACRPLEMKA